MMIAIVSDSSSYLTRDEARMLGVRTVPMTYTQNGCPFTETYIERNGLFEESFSRPGVSLSTAHSSVSAFMGTFQELMRRGFFIICLTISSRLSGAYSSASIAAREVDPVGGRIIVVDSLTTAAGMYFLIRKTRELIDDGLDLMSIASNIEEERENIGIVFSVDDMRPLRKSGRLGIVRQSVGTVLNIRPILMCAEGAVVSAGLARGKNEQMRMMLDKVPKNAKSAAIMYISNPQAPEALRAILAGRGIACELRKLGPVLGIHLGLGVVGIAWSL